MIEFPRGTSLNSPKTLQMIAEVHAVMQHQPGIGNVWSLETFAMLAGREGRPIGPTLMSVILPQYLVRRFISAVQHAVVVAGRVPDVDASRRARSLRRWIARWRRCVAGVLDPAMMLALVADLTILRPVMTFPRSRFQRAQP